MRAPGIANGSVRSYPAYRDVRPCSGPIGAPSGYGMQISRKVAKLSGISGYNDVFRGCIVTNVNMSIIAIISVSLKIFVDDSLVLHILMCEKKMKYIYVRTKYKTDITFRELTEIFTLCWSHYEVSLKRMIISRFGHSYTEN